MAVNVPVQTFPTRLPASSVPPTTVRSSAATNPVGASLKVIVTCVLFAPSFRSSAAIATVAVGAAVSKACT